MKLISTPPLTTRIPSETKDHKARYIGVALATIAFLGAGLALYFGASSLNFTSLANLHSISFGLLGASAIPAIACVIFNKASSPLMTEKEFLNAVKDMTEEEIISYIQKEKPNLSGLGYIKIRKQGGKNKDFQRSSKLETSLVVMTDVRNRTILFKTRKTEESLPSSPKGDFLGKGATKATYATTDLLTNRPIAVGVVSPTIEEEDLKDVTNLESELRGILDNKLVKEKETILKEFTTGLEFQDLPHCCAIRAIGNSASKIFVVSDVAPGKTFSNQEMAMSLQAKRKHVLTIVDTVATMHERGYIHQDLHKNNILIDLESDTCSIIDFGLARKITPTIQDLEETDGGILRDLYLLQKLIYAMGLEEPTRETSPHLYELKQWYTSQERTPGQDGKDVYRSPNFLRGRFTTFARELHKELIIFGISAVDKAEKDLEKSLKS